MRITPQMNFALAIRRFRRELARAIYPVGNDPEVGVLYGIVEGLGEIISEMRKELSESIRLDSIDMEAAQTAYEDSLLDPRFDGTDANREGQYVVESAIRGGTNHE